MLTKILNASCVSKGALACRSGCRACGLDWPMMSLEAVLGEMIAAGSLEIGLPKANNPHQKLESSRAIANRYIRHYNCLLLRYVPH